MKLTLTPIAISLALFISPAQAINLPDDGETLMDAAQQVYGEFFPSNQPTQTFDPWIYRFYPSLAVYLGININDNGVYLLGGPFGNTPQFVGSADDILAMLQDQLGTSSSQNDLCDSSSLPTGFFYTQVGNTVTLSTGGQCIQLPSNPNFCDTLPETGADGQAVATGINALTQTNMTSFSFSGINVPDTTPSIPGVPNIDDLLGAGLGQVIDSTSACIMNAPSAIADYQLNTDICLDVTSQFQSQLGALSQFLPGIEITPPITTNFAGSSVTTLVDDCFSSGAATITDLVSGTTWVQDDNSNYVQIN